MKRRTLLLVAALLGATLAAAGGLEAQTRFYFGAAQDTAVGLIPSTDMRIPIRVSSLCGTDSARLTIRYDPAAIQLTGVTPAALGTAIDTARPAPGLFSVRGSGSVCASDVEVFTVHATLPPATTGTFLWMTVDSLGLQGYAGNQALQLGRSSIGQVCHATQIYGDVDGSGTIDSRDALIVLSAAVGLPVTGFDLAVGDVDRDGLTNSRDALFMLSWAIGLYTPGNLQIGEGAPDACPGAVAPGEAVVFKRNGSGIELLGASSTTPTLVPNTVVGDSAPRLAANGTQIIYQCQDSVLTYYTDICSINTDGTGRRPLTNAYYYTLPDVSPNGIRVLFGYYFYSGPLFLTTDTASAIVTLEFFSGGYGLYPYSAAWSRDGSHFAYTSGGFYTTWNSQVNTYQPRGLWSVDTLAATFVQLDTAFTNTAAAPRWSPAGDSVAYLRNDGRIWAVTATGGVPATPLTSFTGTNNSNGITAFDWGPQGLIFSLDVTGNGQHPSLWLLPSQNAPVQRITATPSGDWQPSFRRNP